VSAGIIFESFFVAAFPMFFIAVLAGGGVSLRRRNIDMEGLPPIDKNLFRLGKFAMLIPWAAMILQGFGVGISPTRVPLLLKWVSLGLWVCGFGFLLAGRIGLGSSFRVGCPKGETTLRTDGIFRYSRNPMYLGIYTTFLAATLYTLNPLVLLIGAGVAAVHHRIVLAEEQCLRKMSGQEYEEYCQRVRRYL
jgi:protein-S-isoprenylcysteine O-methyltransferase Ste14